MGTEDRGQLLEHSVLSFYHVVPGIELMISELGTILLIICCATSQALTKKTTFTFYKQCRLFCEAVVQ